MKKAFQAGHRTGVYVSIARQVDPLQEGRDLREPPRLGREAALGGAGVRSIDMRPQIPPEIEEYRDERWHREGTRQVETAFDAERFIEQVGFAACLTDSRRPGPSLYVAVCGRRDAVMPRNVQKDPEASLDVGPEGRTRGARPGSITRSLRAARRCSSRRA